MKNNKGRNAYYMLPFILAVVGMVFHARKDLKSFYVLLALFLFTGIALKIFLNERPFEVRERDYALVGSYYVFAMWIAFGVYAIYEGLKKYIAPKIAVPAVLAVTVLAAPVLMAKENWDDHDRSGRYTAVAMAKAYLSSCEPNAILFTIGDNDTFPLWYAQEIEGFRTDVRIVCSTLLPTDWYIDQMKQRAYKSAPLPISFTHRQYVDGTRDFMLLDRYNPRRNDTININVFMDSIKSNKYQIEYAEGHYTNAFPSNRVRIPVDRNQVIKNKVVAPALYDSIVPYIDIELPSAVYKHNLIMLDIIRNNNWERPIYFSGGSFDNEDYAWMKDYLQLTGMALKLVPVKTPSEGGMFDLGYVDTNVMYNTVTKFDWGNGGSTEIYHDPQTRKNSITFRKNLVRLMETLIAEGKKDKAKEVIELALKNFPVDYYGFYFITDPFAEGYYQVGEKAKARELLDKLAVKYEQNLKYYKSIGVPAQNTVSGDISNDLEAYRRLLKIMQTNNDPEYYNKYKTKFNTCVSWFSRFGVETEK
jgi:tetratricopeptide (TPR) repeat protein